MYCLECNLIDLRSNAKFCDKCGFSLIKMNPFQRTVVGILAANKAIVKTRFACKVLNFIGVTQNASCSQLSDMTGTPENE